MKLEDVLGLEDHSRTAFNNFSVYNLYSIMPGILFPVLVPINLSVCSFSWHPENGGLGRGVRGQKQNKTNKTAPGGVGSTGFLRHLGFNTNFMLVEKFLLLYYARKWKLGYGLRPKPLGNR